MEKDIEVVPMERIVTALPEDTMGITNMLPDYVVEARLTPVASNETKVELSHYYSTKSLKAKFGSGKLRNGAMVYVKARAFSLL